MAVPMKTTNGNRKLILDVDTGIDDALALAYLASFNNIEILGVIGTYGNVAADTAVYNTAYVLERLGFRNVPVLRGSTRPSLAASFITDAGCAQFHGTDGLGGFGPAVGSPAVACRSGRRTPCRSHARWRTSAGGRRRGCPWRSLRPSAGSHDLFQLSDQPCENRYNQLHLILKLPFLISFLQKKQLIS